MSIINYIKFNKNNLFKFIFNLFLMLLFLYFILLVFFINIFKYTNYYCFNIEYTLVDFFKKIFFDWLLFDFNIFYFIFFVFNIFFSFIFFNYLGYRGTFLLNFISLFFFFVNTIVNYKNILIMNKVYKYNFGLWFLLNNEFKINFSFFIDQISYSFILLTVTIAFFVYIFAFSYFKYEPLVDRFLIFLCMFIGSMILFVSSSNLIVLFLG